MTDLPVHEKIRRYIKDGDFFGPYGFAIIAERAKIPRYKFSLLMAGKKTLMLGDFMRICNALGVPPSMLNDD